MITKVFVAINSLFTSDLNHSLSIGCFLEEALRSIIIGVPCLYLMSFKYQNFPCYFYRLINKIHKTSQCIFWLKYSRHDTKKGICLSFWNLYTNLVHTIFKDLVNAVKCSSECIVLYHWCLRISLKFTERSDRVSKCIQIINIQKSISEFQYS